MSASRAARVRRLGPLPPMRMGGMRPLERKGKDRVADYAIMPTGEGDLFTLEQAFDKGDCFCQSLDPGSSRVEAQTRLFIFRLHVPRA